MAGIVVLAVPLVVRVDHVVDLQEVNARGRVAAAKRGGAVAAGRAAPARSMTQQEKKVSGTNGTAV